MLNLIYNKLCLFETVAPFCASWNPSRKKDATKGCLNCFIYLNDSQQTWDLHQIRKLLDQNLKGNWGEK